MKTLATVTIFESKGGIGASLNGRRGYGPTPAAALRELANRLDTIAQPKTGAKSSTWWRIEIAGPNG